MQNDLYFIFQNEMSLRIIQIQLSRNDINPNLRGSGYWKFNTSLFEDNVFVTEIKQIIK